MWKSRVLYLLVLMTIGAVYIGTNERYLFMLIIVLIGYPCLSFIILPVAGRGIHISCELRDACVIHQKIGMHIKCTYQGILPIGKICLHAEFHNHLFESNEEQIIILENGKGEELFYEVPFTSRDCGRVEMRFSYGVMYDLLGLFSHKLAKIEGRDFTIFPEMIQMEVTMASLPSAKNIGNQYDQNGKGQDVTEVYSIREYQEGDSQRAIHWKLSGKWDKLVVREFSRPSNYDTLILYDTTCSTESSFYHEVVNSVLAVSSSISKSLLNQSHVHHIGSMSKTEFRKSEVEDNASYVQALANMMSTTLPGENEQVLDEFLKRDAGVDFTKIVLVTGTFDEYNAQRLADIADLTVVLISPDREDDVEKTSNYEVITRSIQSLKTKTWILEI